MSFEIAIAIKAVDQFSDVLHSIAGKLDEFGGLFGPW